MRAGGGRAEPDERESWAGERKRWACLSAQWRDTISFRQARNYLSVRRMNRVLWRGYRPFVDPLYLGFQSLSRSPAGWPTRQDLGGPEGRRRFRRWHRPLTHSPTHLRGGREGGREEAEAHRPTAAFPFLRIPKNVRTNELPCCEGASERSNELPIILSRSRGRLDLKCSSNFVQTAKPPFRMLTANSYVRLYLFSAAANATTARRTRIRRATNTTAACGARAPTSAAPRPSCPSARPPSSS